MGRPAKRTVEDLLTEAASRVVEAPHLKPWNYGWFLPEYRLSSSAALRGPNGTVTIEVPARAAFEQAVELLARETGIRDRWDTQELWGVAAGLVVDASASEDHAAAITRAVSGLRSVGTTLILLPVANVLPPESPVYVADCVIGQVDGALFDAIEQRAGGRPLISADEREGAIAGYRSAYGSVVVLATWSQGQSGMAVQHAERRLRTILDIALLLEPRPHDAGLCSLRGATNRPGMRGVAIDRTALQRALEVARASAESAAEIKLVTSMGTSQSLRWHSADPVPLERLLRGTPARRERIDWCARGSSPIARRVQVAARWYAQAHWATDHDDAVLALGSLSMR